jgi:PAS domain S-box-containing protein
VTAGGDNAGIVVVGSIPGSNLPAVSDPEAVPAGSRLVVVEHREEWPADLAAALRRSHPGVRVVAWVAEADEKTLGECIARGFDDVTFGSAHFEHAVEGWRESIEVAVAHAAEQEMYEGLVGLIAEVTERPELADVLCTAVLRMSQLFGIDRVSVVLFQSGDELAFVVAEHEVSLIDNLVIRIDDYPELQMISETGAPVVITDVLRDTLLSGVRSKIETAKVTPRAAVLFPLLHKSKVVGALFLRAREPLEEIENRLVRMGQVIASVTSVAIGAALEHDTLVNELRALVRKKEEADRKVAGLQQFSEFFSHANDGIVVVDLDGSIRYANHAAGAIVQRDAAALPGHPFLDLLSHHSHALAERALRGDSVGDTHGYVDLLVPLGGEQEAVVSAAIRSIEQSEAILVSFRDVTELREIETELRQTKEFLENLIQSSVDAIVAADVNGQIILFNRAAEEFVGYAAKDVVGKMPASSLYPPGEAHEIMRRLRSEAYGGRGRLEMTRKELLSKTGQLVPVNLTASIIYEGNQEIATVGVFSDLRERLKMEEKLSWVQQRLKTTERQAVAVELAGATAHELNQPLTSILGYTEKLRRRIPENDPNRKAVDVIFRETDRMAKIVRKIGQITAYQTKPYVGSSQIFDLGMGDEQEGEESADDTGD